MGCWWHTKKVNRPEGVTLSETLEALGMSQADLAERTGRPKKTINEIVKGKAAITPETALQFERVLGIPASFWNNLERDYRETVARLEEHQRLQRHVECAPYKAAHFKATLAEARALTVEPPETLVPQLIQMCA